MSLTLFSVFSIIFSSMLQSGYFLLALHPVLKWFFFSQLILTWLQTYPVSSFCCCCYGWGFVFISFFFSLQNNISLNFSVVNTNFSFDRKLFLLFFFFFLKQKPYQVLVTTNKNKSSKSNVINLKVREVVDKGFKRGWHLPDPWWWCDWYLSYGSIRQLLEVLAAFHPTKTILDDHIFRWGGGETKKPSQNVGENVK